MAGVHAQNGRLLLTFQYPHHGQRVRCREFLGLADTRENRRLAARIAAQVERDIATGCFDYVTRFPTSRTPKRLGLRSSQAPALADYSWQWLEVHRGHLTPGTFYDYGLLIKKHIACAPLGAIALDEIGRRDIENWISQLQESGAGPRRVNMALARLKSIFRMAEEERLILQNPARMVRNLREPKSTIDPFSAGEIQALLRAAQPGIERAFVATLLLAGLRPSEVLALEWRNVDLERRVISVRRGRTRWGDGMTKTTASEREVDISVSLHGEFEKLASEHRHDGYVFTGARGAGIDWNNFRQRNWRRLVHEAGVRMRPPYQCRHSYAVTLLSSGANPHYIAHQMGHSTLAMVIRHYARWTQKPEREPLEMAPVDEPTA